MKKEKQGPGRPSISEGEATVPLMVRLPPSLLEQLDQARGQEPRSGYARRVLTQTLQEANMEFSVKERLALINQYKILVKLYPEEADYYEKQVSIFQNGYCLHYESDIRNIDKNGVSSEESIEVLEVLSLYRVIYDSYQNITDKEGINKNDINFRGFDALSEVNQYNYLNFRAEEENLFKELNLKNRDLDTHCPMLKTYRLMLKEWIKLGKGLILSKEKLLKILNILDVK